MSPNTKRVERAAKPQRYGASARLRSRTKLSTTVAAENFVFLETLVESGRADSIARAVDLAIAWLRQTEDRARLHEATAAYFDGLTQAAQAEEQTLARRFHLSASGMDFDLEP